VTSAPRGASSNARAELGCNDEDADRDGDRQKGDRQSARTDRYANGFRLTKSEMAGDHSHRTQVGPQLENPRCQCEHAERDEEDAGSLGSDTTGDDKGQREPERTANDRRGERRRELPGNTREFGGFLRRTV
jgi:hypothetical protein